MKRIFIKDALNSDQAQESVLIRGWVRTRRDSKDFSFMELNDGSCLKNIQIVVDGAAQGYDQIKTFTVGSSAEVEGALVESPGKGQKWEVKAGGIKLIGPADQETYPLQKKRHSDEFLRTMAHIRPRTNKFAAVFRIRSETSYAVHKYFRERGYYYIHTPIITGSDCEGAGSMFQLSTQADNPKAAAVEFFGKEANLTVSGQLEAELFAQALGGVYTFGPTFRAENSNTPRHAAEFWMIEPEIAFADLNDNMDLAEDMTKDSLIKPCPGQLRRGRGAVRQVCGQKPHETPCEQHHGPTTLSGCPIGRRLRSWKNQARNSSFRSPLGHGPPDRARALFNRGSL